MKRMVVGCGVVMALAGCASSKPAADLLPVGVGNGLGSAYGNYPTAMSGEATGPAGEHCVVFDWDRPISKDQAMRTKSESCEATDKPGVMVAHEISRTVIPLSQSNVQAAPAGDPDTASDPGK